ncbi:tetratricopeptide repeat protein, partial [Rubrivivax gelatinosus]
MALQDVRRNDRYDTNWRAGVAAVGAGRWGEAERGFQRAVQASPGAHAAWLYLARAQLQLGKLDSAVAAARR